MARPTLSFIAVHMAKEGALKLPVCRTFARAPKSDLAQFRREISFPLANTPHVSVWDIAD
jgi:hypothetical protein